MKNKLLVEVIVPEIDEKYSLFIPINKRIGNVIILINKGISDLSNGEYVCSDTASLYNKNTGEKYDLNSLVRQTNIHNGSTLILF